MQNETQKTETGIELLKLKQKVALSPNRDLALSVILPRLIGAIKHDPTSLKPDGLYEVEKGELQVQLWSAPQWINLVVATPDAAYKILFVCRLYSGRCGKSMDGRVTVRRWERSELFRNWQSDIFEIFDKDSMWLLDIPPTLEPPAIVKAVMTDVNATVGKEVYTF